MRGRMSDAPSYAKPVGVGDVNPAGDRKVERFGWTFEPGAGQSVKPV